MLKRIRTAVLTMSAAGLLGGTAVADLRPLPRDYIPSMPGATDLPPGADGPNGPDKPGDDNDQR